MTDPLRTVWEAIEARGFDPHGKEHDFRSRCPGHDGDNREALHVSEGADRRAVLYCFRGCDAEEIMGALGLEWRDLFPPGHHKHRRRPRPRPEPRGPIDIALDGLSLIGIGYRGMWVADCCPYCGAPGLWIRSDRQGAIEAECSEGCPPDRILGSLETTVAIAEARR